MQNQTTTAPADIDTWTTPKIRVFCQENNFSQMGTKAELVSRIKQGQTKKPRAVRAAAPASPPTLNLAIASPPSAAPSAAIATARIIQLAQSTYVDEGNTISTPDGATKYPVVISEGVRYAHFGATNFVAIPGPQPQVTVSATPPSASPSAAPGLDLLTSTPPANVPVVEKAARPTPVLLFRTPDAEALEIKNSAGKTTGFLLFEATDTFGISIVKTYKDETTGTLKVASSHLIRWGRGNEMTTSLQGFLNWSAAQGGKAIAAYNAHLVKAA